MSEQKYTYGCLPPKKDLRDYKLCSANVQQDFPESFELTNLPYVKQQGQINSCHDDKTEVLTKSGWKLFKDITYSDELATADINTGNLIFETPTSIICQPYDGIMFKGSHRSLDFMVTPNHKMVVRAWEHSKRGLSDNYSMVEAQNLGWYSGLRLDFHQYKGDAPAVHFEEEKISNGNILPAFDIDMETWVQFLGIYIAEGSMDSDGPRYHYRFQIAAVKKREREFVKNLLNKINVSNSDVYKDRYMICNKRIWNKLCEYGFKDVRAWEKRIPDFIFDLDEKYIKLFLYAYAMGDGNFRKTGTVSYATTSPYIADGIDRLSILCGNSIKTKIYTIEELNHHDSYIKGRLIEAKHSQFIMWSRINSQNIDRKKNITYVHYKGNVYCAEVPTYHTLITRRNGNILFSGNCCAHATSSIIEYHDKNRHTMSTNFIYGIQKKLFNQNEMGMYLSQAAEIVLKYGDTLEIDCRGNNEIPVAWEIAEKAFDTEEIMKRAYNYRISSYYLCQSDNDVKYALMNYGPVLGSIHWRDKFSLDEDAVITFDTSSNGGGHAVCIYGWNEKGWLIQNSWGYKFGNYGRFILPFSYGFMEARALIDYDNEEDLALMKPKMNKFKNFIYKLLNKLINKVNPYKIG